MPENLTFFDAATAGSVFKSAWGIISANFVGIAVLIGAFVGSSLKKGTFISSYQVALTRDSGRKNFRFFRPATLAGGLMVCPPLNY